MKPSALLSSTIAIAVLGAACSAPETTVSTGPTASPSASTDASVQPAPATSASSVASVQPAPTSSAGDPNVKARCMLPKGVSEPGRGCDPCFASVAAERTKQPAIIHYESWNFFGGAARLLVQPNGHAIWTFEPSDPKTPPAHAEADLTPVEIAAFQKTMHDHKLCATTPSLRFGIPDESTPLLAICLPTDKCEISLWAGEWDERPDAKASLAALDALVELVRKRAKP